MFSCWTTLIYVGTDQYRTMSMLSEEEADARFQRIYIQVSEELEACREMVRLLPIKMEKIRRIVAT